MINRYFAYVNHEHVRAYEELGWQHPISAVNYPRLGEHGTTMEWIGKGNPPIPGKSNHAIPEKILVAAVDKHREVAVEYGFYSTDAMRIALGAAGIGELIEALKWYASSDAWKLDQLEGPNGDYGRRARSVVKRWINPSPE